MKAGSSLAEGPGTKFFWLATVQRDRRFELYCFFHEIPDPDLLTYSVNVTVEAFPLISNPYSFPDEMAKAKPKQRNPFLDDITEDWQHGLHAELPRQVIYGCAGEPLHE